MARAGIWTRWAFSLPPQNAEVEASWTSDPDAETNIILGKPCRSGCCFCALGERLVAPIWWRLPEPQSDNADQT